MNIGGIMDPSPPTHTSTVIPSPLSAVVFIPTYNKQ